VSTGSPLPRWSTVPTGKSPLIRRRFRCWLITYSFLGWWPEHALSITRLVRARYSFLPTSLTHSDQLWEDLGSWRSAIRKKARTFVTQRYQWDPENRCEQNIVIANHLLGNGGLFLRDGTDKEVS
jgi:hypothetical protein